MIQVLIVEVSQVVCANHKDQFQIRMCYENSYDKIFKLKNSAERCQRRLGNISVEIAQH